MGSNRTLKTYSKRGALYIASRYRTLRNWRTVLQLLAKLHQIQKGISRPQFGNQTYRLAILRPSTAFRTQNNFASLRSRIPVHSDAWVQLGYK